MIAEMLQLMNYLLPSSQHILSLFTKSQMQFNSIPRFHLLFLFGIPKTHDIIH